MALLKQHLGIINKFTLFLFVMLGLTSRKISIALPLHTVDTLSKTHEILEKNQIWKSDFSAAVINNFGNRIVHRGCYFHYTTAIYKGTQLVGPTTTHKNAASP